MQETLENVSIYFNGGKLGMSKDYLCLHKIHLCTVDIHFVFKNTNTYMYTWIYLGNIP